MKRCDQFESEGESEIVNILDNVAKQRVENRDNATKDFLWKRALSLAHEDPEIRELVMRKIDLEALSKRGVHISAKCTRAALVHELVVKCGMSNKIFCENADYRKRSKRMMDCIRENINKALDN